MKRYYSLLNRPNLNKIIIPLIIIFQVIDMWMETAVLSARSGYEARLRRMLKARSAVRRNSKGCVKSWVGETSVGKGTFILQALYDSENAIGLALKLVSELDEKDGGLESVLEAPPIVGVFEVEAEDVL